MNLKTIIFGMNCPGYNGPIASSFIIFEVKLLEVFR